MTYYLAHSLVRLRDEVNARWPNRDKTSDGWIGDTSHQARKSDHNPDWDAGGVVRAIDIDIDGIDVDLLLRSVIGDHRVWYVIFNRKIYSRTYGFVARDYNGSNPHEKHVHVSISHSKDAETDTTRWLELPKRQARLPKKFRQLRTNMRNVYRSIPDQPRRRRVLAAAIKGLNETFKR